MEPQDALLLHKVCSQLLGAKTAAGVLGALSAIWASPPARVTLFAVHTGANGRPERLDVAASLGSLTHTGFPPGSRLHHRDTPLSSRWASAPDGICLVGDVALDLALEPEITAECTDRGIAAFVLMSLVLEGRWIGLLHVEWCTPQPLSERDHELYEALRGHVAMVLDYRRLLAPPQEPGHGDSHRLLEALIEHTPSVIFAKDLSGRYLFANRQFRRTAGKTREEIIGHTDAEVWPSSSAEEGVRHDQEVIERGGRIEYEERNLLADGTSRDNFKIKFVLYDDAGRPTAICGIATDMTAMRRVEHERSALQQQVIETQRAALQELSTPLIPLAEGVLVMPLIGSVDPVRAAQIMEALLAGITAHRARLVIIDITGVRTVDTQAADALIKSTRAARLLGAQVLLTGISAAVAQTLVHLGIELSDMLTLSSLESGIRYALGKLR